MNVPTIKEEFGIKETGNVEKRVKADIAERNRIREVEKNFDGFGRRCKIKSRVSDSTGGLRLAFFVNIQLWEYGQI